jgi:hypothetical protein
VEGRRWAKVPSRTHAEQTQGGYDDGRWQPASPPDTRMISTRSSLTRPSPDDDPEAFADSEYRVDPYSLDNKPYLLEYCAVCEWEPLPLEWPEPV